MDLIIQTFGTSICRDNEGFVISNSEGKKRIHADGVDSIQIGKGIQITSDAVMLAIEHEIEILFVNRSGDPMARVWSSRYGSISTIRKGQLMFTRSADAVDWIKAVLAKKIVNQQAMLLSMNEQQKINAIIIDRAISRLEEYIYKIKDVKAEQLADVAAILRGWEGFASHIYFETLNYFLPENYRMVNRTQHPAMDVINAFLNYGYGILYGKVESALIKAGIDPYIGILHRDAYNRPVLVYDVIEIYRVWVDFVIYSIAQQNIITNDLYSIRDDGSYWLESLGRRVLIQSMNDYLDELVLINGNKRSRVTHINLYAQNLAQTFKKYQ